MSLVLARPKESYDAGEEAQMRAALTAEDRKNRKKGADVELRDELLILRSPDGTRWKITVSNVGVVGASAV